MRDFRAACGDAHVKAILATGDLKTLRNVAQASTGLHDGGRRFHQDLDRQGSGQRHAAGDARHAAHDPRLSGCAPASRSATSRPAASPPPRTCSNYQILMKEELGREWLEPDLFPRRRLEPARRYRAPARTSRHRPLFGLQPPPGGMIAMSVAQLLRRRWTTARRPKPTPKRAPGSTRHDAGFGHFIGGAFVAPQVGELLRHARAGDRASCWRALAQRQRGGCRCRRQRGAQGAGASGPKLGGHGPRAPSLCAGPR